MGWGRSAARVQKVQRVRPAFGRLVQRVVVAASPQIIKKGRGSAAGCVEGLWKKVLKIDRPLAGGFLSLTGPSAPRVVVSPLRAMSIKSALRIYLSVSYGIVSILVISRCAAPPYPATPDFLHRKACHTILRSLCSLTNRVPSGGQNKSLYAFL